MQKFRLHGRERNAQHQHIRSPDLFHQLFRLGVLTPVVALFAHQQQNPPIFLRLVLQQFHSITHRVQNRVAAITLFQVLQRFAQVFARMGVIVNQMRMRIESNQCRLAAVIGEKQIE